MTPSLALCVSGESVLTTIPGCTGHAQDATGFGALSTSTKHIRPFDLLVIYPSSDRTLYVQFPAIISFLEPYLVSLPLMIADSELLTHDNNI